MGTRSITHIYDDHTEAVLATVYRQFDGYPSGMGQDLADLMKGRRLVNGFGSDDTEDVASNGIGCFAATLIRVLKEQSGIGGIYLMAPGTNDHGEEYVYKISTTKADEDDFRATGGFRFKVETVMGGYSGKPRKLVTLFEGDPNDFDAAKAEKVASEAYGE